MEIRRVLLRIIEHCSYVTFCYYLFLIYEDLIDIFLYLFISSFCETMELPCEYHWHSIEEKWNIENCIEHGYNLPHYSHRDKVSEPYRRSRDNCKIESIKVVFTDRMTCLRPMDQDRAKEPASEEDGCYGGEFFSIRGHRLIMYKWCMIYAIYLVE